MTSPLETRRKWASVQRDVSPATPRLRIGITASFTSEPIEPYLGVAIVEHGVTPPVIDFAPINQVFQTVLDPAAAFPAAPDLLVVLWRIEDVFAADFERFQLGDDEAGERIVGAAEELALAVADVPARDGVECSLALPPLPHDVAGDLRDPARSIRLGAMHRRVLDAMTAATADAKGCALLDLDAIQRAIGAESGLDVTKWMLYRQPYSKEMIAAVADAVATSVVRSIGPTPKVLALDCDGTLWGGIVGEDGIAGIQLAEDFPGRAYVEFQKACLRLQRAGVMLVVVSKNNPEDVAEVFAQHDAMVLQGGDIAGWRVNWEPKSQNLLSLAEELNVGIDSFVFVDDNQHEIAEVFSRVPGIATLLVPEDPEHLPGLLGASGLFRDMRTTAVDARRTTMMLEQKSRDDARQAMSEAEFLESLDMVVEYFPVTDEHLARVTQLIGKTNQFNLTTVRRSDAEVSSLAASSDHRLRAVRVTDRFGEYGLVGVAIVDERGDTPSIDTFLLSCRALGRGVETAFLAALTAELGSPVRAEYRPTSKNAKASGFYPAHGFQDVGDGWFELPVNASVAAPGHIELQTEC